ncbi:high mobility group nucleosome-binding domain-containing protein 5-like [Venturia canescens]|uniref:high mobility group nucleosome-binding domain-containing protein 5-like n=1 Tax=Venturia canescens TaxID=32260 RepID=UPI001C9CCE00|nr:high mobility group nucleosome-binding domain-containing protein 5-like [Venturia canescens]
MSRLFHVVVDEWEAAARSKSGKNAQITEEQIDDREVEDQGDEEEGMVDKQGTRGESQQEGGEEMDKELKEYGNGSRIGERAEEREDEDRGDEEKGMGDKQGTGGENEQEGGEEMRKELMGNNDKNIEPAKKKRRKRRSPEEIAMEEYKKFCSPRYMNVALNK